ncbi:hypothetical protein BJ875DRAFT_447413 [Amylocarpus encephaloides]|uniref:C2H2-type domain-containing protein n=1 Tax=Amylocarpus encephaloides TaxID=45428 RepID=A0A9P8CBY6_9HELO|nr:hypothetical protein BJ875DRAFT_447413 [Amylocarpus encephaloides]
MDAHVESKVKALKFEKLGQTVVQQVDKVSLEPLPTSSHQQDIVTAASLKGLCKDCLLYFTELASSLADATLQNAINIGYDRDCSISLVNEERTRFEVWTASVWEPPSLIFDAEDEKLPSTHDVARRAKRILRDLYDSLHKASLIVSGLEANEIWLTDDVSDSDGGFTDSCKIPDHQRTSELEELLASISESNSRLVKLSLVLRKAVRPDDYAKASFRHKFDPTLDIEFVKSKFKGALNSSDWLLERLGRAVTERREYLKSYETNLMELGPQTSKSYDASPSGAIAPPKQTFQEPFNRLPELHIELRTPFQCPFCRQTIVMNGWAEWRKHTYADLKAYVCTFEECDMRLFSDPDEWFEHELKTHRREWVCFLCQTCTSTKAAFEWHLQSTHNLTNVAEIEALLLQSEEPVDEFPPGSCLLCDEWSRGISTKHARWGSIDDFQRHLGDHLESLALQALVRNANIKVKKLEQLQKS